MKIYLTAITFIILLSIQNFTFAQSGSPYSSIGLGLIKEPGGARNEAFGGAGAALGAYDYINPVNPASYTSQDTNTFLVDIGVMGKRTKYSTSKMSESAYDYNIDNITVAFPVARWWKASFSISPFSEVKYDIKETKTFSYNGHDINSEYQYTGSGGINNLNFGSGFKVSDFLSLGFNASYLFGFNSYVYEIDPDIQYSASTYNDRYIKTGDFHITVGAQYNINLNNIWNLTAGLVYSPENKLRGSYEERSFTELVTAGDIDDNVAELITDNSFGYYLPHTVTGGFALKREPEKNNPKNTFLFTLDYKFSNWNSVADKMGQNLANASSFCGGLEYIPQKRAYKGYWKRIRYRAGFNLTETYMLLNGEQINNNKFTVGLGLPVKYSRTTFNITYQRGVLGSKEGMGIRESYNVFKFSVNIYDFWFIKPKID